MKSSSSSSSSSSSFSKSKEWTANEKIQSEEAKKNLNIWPLDEFNTILLNEVHPRNYISTKATESIEYDIVAIGSGAGGLVSSKQSARRGAKSAMISEYLAGGDCLNVGCVPSKALLRCSKAILEAKRAKEFGVLADFQGIDFASIMKRLRRLRAKISPADGHDATEATGATVFQGRGVFTSKNTISVQDKTIQFKKCVVATGGSPYIPMTIPGLKDAPYTTNEILFNLETLPPRLVILGSGAIALEMAQVFSTFGSEVVVLNRGERLFQSNHGDAEAAKLLQSQLESYGVTFIMNATLKQVETLQDRDENDCTKLPLMKVFIESNNSTHNLECECLLVATGRKPNVQNMGLEKANVKYDAAQGILVNQFAQSISNPNVYAVGDCCANVPKLTHMSGEMAKLAVQHSLFHDTQEFNLDHFIVPATMYTEPEYCTVGICSEEMALQNNVQVDTYRAGLEHNDRAILESNNVGFVKILCKKDTDEIIGATIVADRAGEMINEVTLAMKHNVGLRGIGRNIHCYPTTGEAVMGAGLGFVNKHWKTL